MIIGSGYSIAGNDAFASAAYTEELVSQAPASLPADGLSNIGITGPFPIEGGSVDRIPQVIAAGSPQAFYNVPINTDKPFRAISYKRFVDGVLTFEANNDSAIGGGETSTYGLQTSHQPVGPASNRVHCPPRRRHGHTFFFFTRGSSGGIDGRIMATRKEEHEKRILKLIERLLKAIRDYFARNYDGKDSD